MKGSKMKNPIFHVALAVENISEAREFYKNTLNCSERKDASGESFSVFNFYGAQLVLIEDPEQIEKHNLDQEIEPVKHFGIIMDWDEWHSLVEVLRLKKINFRVEPNIVDHDNVGKVGNMFVADPSGNFIEFKTYKDSSKIL